MITKYKLFLEKSNLSKFGIDNKIINLIHTEIGLSDNFKWEDYSKNLEFELFVLYTKIYNDVHDKDKCILIKNSNNQCIIYFQNGIFQIKIIYNNHIINNETIPYNMFEKYYTKFIKHCQGFYLINDYPNKKSIHLKDNLQNELFELCEFKYGQMFKNLYQTYFKQLKSLMKEYFDDFEMTVDDLKYYEMLSKDVFKLREYTNNIIQYNNSKQLIDKYGYDYVIKNKDEIANEIALNNYKRIRKVLTFISERKSFNNIKLNNALYTIEIDNIYNKKFLNEFEHLKNATKFDLI